MLRNLLFLVLLLVSSPVWAEPLSMQDFARIPVQHEGRIKPLDTFARVTLQAFSGKDHLQGLGADDWLAEALFDPISSAGRPVFMLREAPLRHRLGLPERQIPLYSYNELTAGLSKTIPDIEAIDKKPATAVSAEDKSLLNIHENALIYSQILRTLTLILPLNLEVPPPWSRQIKTDANGTISYMALRRFERDIETATKKIIAHKGDDLSSYTENERNTALLSYRLALMGDAASSNQLLRIIPVDWAEAGGEWQSPWAVLQQGRGSPDTGKLLQIWRDLAIGWQNENKALWEASAKSAVIFPSELTNLSSWRIDLEVAVSQLKPLPLSTILYAIAFLLTLGFFITTKPFLRKAALLALGLGAAAHTSAIAARIILLQRPPVSTLYESIIVVALICVVAGTLIETRVKNGAGLFVASVSGLFLGLMASSFGNEADTLRLLSAVLDTRFWLATHVMCITFGYGWCVIVALLAHLNLANRAFRLAPAETVSSLTTMTAHISVIALLFTAIGTILGGIWADQSWGRFWGWDPKENGALLIVLWLSWLLHGKLSGHLTPVRLLAGQAFLSVVVAAAWLGVNLLGVGLHSYGFTDGLFWGLGLFAILEVIYIALTWHLIARQTPHAP